MLIVRTGGERSGRSTKRVSNLKFCSTRAGRRRRAPPMADQRRETGDRAHGHAAAAVSLQTVVDANERCLCATIVLAERHDTSGADAVMRETRSGVYSRARSRSWSTPARVPRDVVVVLQSVLEHDVASCRGRAPRRCRDRSGDPARRTARRVLVNWIDRDDACRARGLEDERPHVRVRRERVRTREEHEHDLNLFRIGADVRDGRIPTCGRVEQIVHRVGQELHLPTTTTPTTCTCTCTCTCTYYWKKKKKKKKKKQQHFFFFGIALAARPSARRVHEPRGLTSSYSLGECHEAPGFRRRCARGCSRMLEVGERQKDTTPPAMAPAPSAAATDTGMKMDSSKMMMDSIEEGHDQEEAVSVLPRRTSGRGLTVAPFCLSYEISNVPRVVRPTTGTRRARRSPAGLTAPNRTRPAPGSTRTDCRGRPSTAYLLGHDAHLAAGRHAHDRADHAHHAARHGHGQIHEANAPSHAVGAELEEATHGHVKIVGEIVGASRRDVARRCAHRAVGHVRRVHHRKDRRAAADERRDSP